MTDKKTVLYVSSIDEAIDLFDLPIEGCPNQDSWGLVAEGENRVRIEFPDFEETITLPMEEYTDLCSYTGVEEYSISDATAYVTSVGAASIREWDSGVSVASWLDDEYSRAVSTIYVMEYEQGWREWPVSPETV